MAVSPNFEANGNHRGRIPQVALNPIYFSPDENPSLHQAVLPVVPQGDALAGLSQLARYGIPD
jgi:hypothetical protein